MSIELVDKIRLTEPINKRTIAFVDGQNLFHAAKEAFTGKYTDRLAGIKFPNYDVKALAKKICSEQGWSLKSVRFYSGVPDIEYSEYLHFFWAIKIRILKSQGVWIFTRRLRHDRESGIKHTQWIQINYEMYSQCIDCHDYDSKIYKMIIARRKQLKLKL